MSRVGRLAGALLAESEGDFFLIGNLKRPCDFAAAGFLRPTGEIDALVAPYLRLERAGDARVPGPWLKTTLEGEALPQLLSERLLIERNGSVSDRLWRLIVSADPDADAPPESAVIDADWFTAMPGHLWRIIRESVLRCV
jgi:hypothetical protein